MDKMVIHLGRRFSFRTLNVYFSPDPNVKRGGYCDERRRHNIEKRTSFASCRENGKFFFSYLILLSSLIVSQRQPAGRPIRRTRC